LRLSLAVVLLATGGCRRTMEADPLIPPTEDAVEAWDLALGEIVTEDGYVDYAALEQRRDVLVDYVAWLGLEDAWVGRVTKDWHAQYLNAYNALVLFQVLERGVPSSVTEVHDWLPVDGAAFFHLTQFELGVEHLTLSEIENERLRWKEMDYRDHAALNCAARSCPPMRGELYRKPLLHDQLDNQMRRWLMDDARGVRFEGDKVLFNPIFDWYARDFHFFSAGKDICTIAAEHTAGPKRTKLAELAAKGCPHDFYAYDWGLNQSR
jgi:hypothetical protein